MKPIVVLSSCLLASAAWPAVITAEIDTQAKLVHTVIKVQEPATEFRMPAWAPGDYRITNFGKDIRDVAFFNADKAVAFKRTNDPNAWQVPDGATEVRYTVPQLRPGIFSENLRITDSEAFIQGPAVWGYFVGHTQEHQKLQLRCKPVEGLRFECPLPSEEDGVFRAADYDTLIDSPIVVGKNLRVIEFSVKGKPHKIVGFGRSESAKLQSFADAAAPIVEAANSLFGELPYDRYYFLLDFGGPGGGLEHLNCARLAMWPGLDGKLASSFLAHEYFHAFNVKRIRARVLGPFDYTKPAITGSLWWAEGVTDYYAAVLTLRAGLQSRDDFLSDLSQQLRDLKRNPARLKTSADESSRRVWEANNSSGFGGVDYYQKGKLIGMVLDLAIRGETQGKKSLDDVMRSLFAECKSGKPGFAENRIRELCVEIGGPALGPIYDASVMQAVELPVDAVIGKVGLILASGRLAVDQKAPAAAKSIAEGWLKSRAAPTSGSSKSQILLAG